MSRKIEKLTRRKFLKDTSVNSLMLSSAPVAAVWPMEVDQEELTELPRLPLVVLSMSSLSPDIAERIRAISGQISLHSGFGGAEMETLLPEINVLMGGLNEYQLRMAVNLKWVQSPSAGVEHYLNKSFVSSPVLLTNAKGCYAPAIAEHVFGLLFGLTRGIAGQAVNMKSGLWADAGAMLELRGLTMGIVGFGGIGRETARRAQAMDMRVLAADVRPLYRENLGGLVEACYLVQDEGWYRMLEKCDVVVCAAPHTAASEGMFDDRAFRAMKDGAFFINVSRGKLVKTPSLQAAIESGNIAGAGLDVTDPEPLPSGHPLWSLGNVIVTSHIAGRGQYSWLRVQEVFAENIRRFVYGMPLLNLVDKQAGF